MHIRPFEQTPFSLNDYHADLTEQRLDVSVQNEANPPIEFVSYDSRNIRPNTLFLCKGNAFKRDYLLSAVDQGAVAYVADRDMDVPIPGLIVSDVRKALSVCAQRYYEWPQKQLRILSVTGTKGKSTTMMFLRAILNHHFAARGQKPVGVISSIDTFDGYETFKTRMTTPEPLELFGLLRNCVSAGLTTMLMESSSQALKYERIDGIHFDIAGFLNISPDHISSVEHLDFEDYFSSKLKIFEKTAHAIINLDTDHVERVLDAAKICDSITTLSIRQPADYFADQIAFQGDGVHLRIHSPSGVHAYRIGLHGTFNAENALMATAIAERFGAAAASIESGLKEVVAQGRMEFYPTKDRALIGLVDFAHNGLSFDKVFEAMKDELPDYRQVAVFSTVGNKAQNRRKGMGISAGRHVDFCYLTQDDNNFEPVSQINAEIARYLDEYHCPWTEITDRPQAIHQAFLDAAAHYEKTGERTLIFVLGKGDETNMRVDGRYVDCPTDGETVRAAVADYDGSHEALHQAAQGGKQ